MGQKLRNAGFGVGVVAAAWVAAGCSDASAAGANGATASTSVRLALSSSDDGGSGGGELAGLDAQGSRIVLDEARAIVRHIDLYLPDGVSCADPSLPAAVICESSDDSIDDDSSGGGKLRIEGPFVVDLIAGTSTPALEDIELPAGTYRRVDVRFDDEEGLVATSDALAGNTLYAAGAFDRDGTVTPLSLTLRFNEDARFESDAGFTVAAGDNASVVLSMDVATWFDALPITQCLQDGDLELQDGSLQIDERSDCSDIESTLKDAIKRSGRLD